MKRILFLSIAVLQTLFAMAQDNSRAFEAGRAAGKVVGILLIILLALWLIRRSRK